MLTPASAATSLRRSPGTRRLVPAGRLACSGVILARRETRNSRASLRWSTPGAYAPRPRGWGALPVHLSAGTSSPSQPAVSWIAMNTTVRHRAHLGVAVAVLAASLTGCAAEHATDRSSTTSTAPAATPSSEPTSGEAVPTDPAGVVRIRLIIGDDVATATLEDTAAARDFAAMLPMTIDMHDLFGREKPGRLPRQLSIDRARREFDYQVGELAYWSPGNDIAI